MIVEIAGRAAVGALILAAGISSASAQGLELGFSYAARETTEISDNDIIALYGAYTWTEGDRGARVALSFGSRNEDFSGDYPLLASADALGFRTAGAGQLGYGVRLDWAEDLSTSSEIFAGYQIPVADRFGLRGTVGLQSITDPLPGREDFGVFAVAEATFYPSDNWAIRGGVQADDGGFLLGTSFEVQLWQSDVSVEIETVFAPEDHYGVDSFENMMVTFRYTPGSGDLRDLATSMPRRLGHRYVAAQ